MSRPALRAISRRTIRARLVSAVLLALALRALIPIGFMPATDGTLSLMICPGGFPPALLPEEKAMQDGMGMPMPQPYHHGHGIMDDGYCTFTTGFSSAPPPLLLAVLALLVASLAAVLTRPSAPEGLRLLHIPQARAPPVRT